MIENPRHRGRIIAPTYGDAVEACVEGPSGLKAINPDVQFHPATPGGSKVTWPNGSEALVFGTNSPRDVDRLRAGGNRHIDWWEEVAANPHLRKAWNQADLGLRLGDHPHSIGSTTPRQTKDYAGVVGSDWVGVRNLPGTVITHATLYDNPYNSTEWVERMRSRYEGTNLGRQELYGQLVGEIEGALWQQAQIEQYRVSETPELVRIVVAIDPAVTAGDNSDDTGIVACGKGVDGHAYVLKDHTCHLPPQQWAARAINLFHELDADRVIAETNNGGDLVETVLRTQDERVPFSKVHASRGKRTRAEPIAALYEQGKVHHLGGLPQLEDQMCMWVPGDEASPDRIDALVWALTELMMSGGPGSFQAPQGQMPGALGRW